MMSPNNAPQNQNAGNSSQSQEPANKPYIACLKKIGKAISSLLRKCWSKRRALPRLIRWKLRRMAEYVLSWLAEVRVPIVLGVLFVFLHKPIEEFVVERLVAPILAHFDTRWPSSLVALALAVILALRWIQLCRRRYIVGGKVVLSAFFILLGYGYYRLFRPDFEFYGLFDKACLIVFADLIPLACFVPLFLWIRALCTKRRANQERQAAESVEGFLTDHPLTEEEEELSGWTSQAQALTQKLLATDTSHAAFSLGIVASWGEGKSSFMGIMQRYLQQVRQEVIVMHFNPWLYDKEAQLTKVFFEELRRTLAPYSSKLSKSIDNYADLLLAVDSSWLKFAHQLLRLSQRSTVEQFDKLSRDIEELGRKVVIFIDDVDRLTREELMELFNLVRNSSNLPCLYFVLAYDKSYVLKTLQSDGEHMTRYPEKILQEEYPLPKLAPYKMWAVLEESLNKTRLGQEDEDKVSKLLGELKGEEVNLPYHLTTIRMVKRMANAFNSRYELLHKVGVVPFDLFIFELIYYVYPKVYDFLTEMHKVELNRLRSANREGFAPHPTNNISPLFLSRTNDRGIEYIKLSLDKKGSKDTSSIVLTLEQLGFDLTDGYKREIVVKKIVALLDLLWGQERELALGQINYGAYWERYFDRGLQKGDLSQEEFASFLADTNPTERRKCLKRWSQEKPIAFMQEILGYQTKDPKEMSVFVWSMFAWNEISDISITFDCNKIDQIINTAKPAADWGEAEFLRILQDEDILSAAFDYTIAWLNRGYRGNAILHKKSLQEIQGSIFKNVAAKANCLELYTKYWLKTRDHDPFILRENKPWIDECMREHIIKEGIEQFSKYTLSRTQEQGDFIYYLHDIPWENLTALAEDLRTDSKNQGDNNFLRFIKLALDEEQRLQTEMKRDVWTSRRVKIRLSREQWEPKEEPAFLLSISNASHEEHPFLFSKSDANES